MASDGFYDNIPNPKKREYILEGAFWDGFRSGARYWVWLYFVFFGVSTYVAETWPMVFWNMFMTIISIGTIWMAWRYKE